MTRLTRAQAAALHERIASMLRFLGRCQQRFDKRRFDPRSKFYQAVHCAFDAIPGLCVALHYESVG